TTHKLRETKTYLVKNRSEHDRQVLIEHPYRADWKLVTPEKASERSQDVYRFQLEVPTGKTAQLQVVEEQSRPQAMALLAIGDQEMQLLINSSVASPRMKEALKQVLDLRAKLASTGR